MPKHIVISGAYTISSAGDDAGLIVLTQHLREQVGNDTRFTVLARHPSRQFAQQYKVCVEPNLEYPSRAESAGRSLRGCNPDDSPAEMERILRLFASADLLVLGAGNFLNENSIGFMRGMLARFCLKTWLADWVGLPVMLYGLSASPLSQPYACRAAEWMLRRAAAVTFREHASPEILQAAGVRLPAYQVLPDPVFGMPKAPPGRELELLRQEAMPAPCGPRLAVALRPTGWPDDRNRAYLALMATCVERWLAADSTRDAIFIPQCTYAVEGVATDDRLVAEAVASLVSPRLQSRLHRVRGSWSPPDTECFYRTATAAFTIRLHGAAFALRCGVPVAAVAYEPKVSGMLDSVACPDSWRLPLNASADRICAVLDSIVKTPESVMGSIMGSIQARIAEHARLIPQYAAIARGVMR